MAQQVKVLATEPEYDLRGLTPERSKEESTDSCKVLLRPSSPTLRGVSRTPVFSLQTAMEGRLPQRVRELCCPHFLKLPLIQTFEKSVQTTVLDLFELPNPFPSL